MILHFRNILVPLTMLAACSEPGTVVTGTQTGMHLTADTEDIEPEHIQNTLSEIRQVPEEPSDAGGDLQFANIVNADYRMVWQWFHPDLPETQHIPVKPGIWQTVTGKFGTEITINTSEFDIQHSPGNQFSLILLEAPDKMSMLRSGVQTTSGNRLLESAGALYMALSDGRRRYNLKREGKLWVKHPVPLSGNYGVFYSSLDRFGKMNSESGRVRVTQCRGIRHDDHYSTFQFTADSAPWQTVHFYKLDGPGLHWSKECSYNGTEFDDTADYHEFSTLLFQTLGVQTRNYMIPLGGNLVPIENIDAAAVHYRQGEGQGLIEIHYRNGKNDNTAPLENRPVLVARTGWIQFARYMNSTRNPEIEFSADLNGGVTAGLIYAIGNASNCLVLQPWLPQNGILEDGVLCHSLPADGCRLVSVIRKDGILFYATADAAKSGRVVFRYRPCGAGFGLDQEVFLP